MMRPIEDLCLNQRFSEKRGNPFAWRVNVFAKIGMMNETFAADLVVHIHPPDRQPLRSTTAGELGPDQVILAAQLLAGKKEFSLEVA